jgi:hypothetical protein
MGRKGKVQEWCSGCGWGWKCGKRGLLSENGVGCQPRGADGIKSIATSVNYDVRGTGDEFDSWFGLNLLYR